MFAEMTTAAKVIAFIVIAVPLAVIITIVYRFLEGPIARIGMMKNIKTAHGDLMVSIPEFKTSSAIVSNGYSISTSGDFFFHYQNKEISSPCGLHVGILLDEAINGLPWLDTYGLPNQKQEDPYKKYPIGMHRGTIYYATDRNGRNYYINFEPDPVEAPAPKPGTVEWYKKKMFG